MSTGADAAHHAVPAALGIDLATPDPVPEAGIEAAVALMRAGTMFRYAEAGAKPGPAAMLEQELATSVGRRFALGTNSCGAAMFLALHALGVRPGDPVLMNAWTLAPVPGAVQHAGARAVLVETTPDLVVDLVDLETKAAAHPGAVLLLSHMRGHIADLDAVATISARHGLRLVEDCAHSMGGGWAGRPTGTFGAVGCFSTQGYKHLNSGEGGLLVTDDEEVAARAVLASGSYMLYGQHLARPASAAFEPFTRDEANHSMRMTDLTAAVLRPQLAELPDRVAGWNARYQCLSQGLSRLPWLRLTHRPPQEEFVGSSLQFFAEHLTAEQMATFCAVADDLGVHVKWFGRPVPVGFTSAYSDWRYTRPDPLPGTDAVLARLCDIRIPLSLPLDLCDDVVAILDHSHRVAERAGTTSRTSSTTSVSPKATTIMDEQTRTYR